MLRTASPQQLEESRNGPTQGLRGSGPADTLILLSRTVRKYSSVVLSHWAVVPHYGSLGNVPAVCQQQRPAHPCLLWMDQAETAVGS